MSSDEGLTVKTPVFKIRCGGLFIPLLRGNKFCFQEMTNCCEIFPEHFATVIASSLAHQENNFAKQQQFLMFPPQLLMFPRLRGLMKYAACLLELHMKSPRKLLQEKLMEKLIMNFPNLCAAKIPLCCKIDNQESSRLNEQREFTFALCFMKTLRLFLSIALRILTAHILRERAH